MTENSVVFLPVPEKFIEKISSERDSAKLRLASIDDAARAAKIEVSAFTVNPDIPIPVEISDDNEKLNLDNLSWEMILSGMLHVIEAGKEKQEWIDYYRRFVLVLRPNILPEFTEAAIVKARNGDFNAALEILSVLRALFPLSRIVGLNRALVLEEQAAQYRRSGKNNEIGARNAAAAAYGELLELEPPFPDALLNGAFFFLFQEKYQKAAECFSRYIEIVDYATQFPAQDENKRKQAEEALKEIKDNGLDDESFAEAQGLIEEGRVEEGLCHIRDFLERKTLVWNGWFMLGWALRLLGRYTDGEAAFRKAIELGGGSCDTRNELAICLMETGNLAGARRELEIALAEDPENIKIISNLAVLAMKAGEKDKAAAFFRTVLELDGDDPVAKNYLKNV